MKKIIEEATAQFKQNMEALCENIDQEKPSPGMLSNLTEALKVSSSQASRHAIQSYLESLDSKKKVLVVGEKTYRLKGPSARELITFFGKITFSRNLYQEDRGGQAFIPVDRQVGISGRSATPEVRGSVLYASAHATPEEVTQLFGKVALFDISATAVKNIIRKADDTFAEHEDEIMAAIHEGEEVPQEAVTLVASIDGANVLLNEPGGRKGRPQERPGEKESGASSYRNAMVGATSFYGGATSKKEGPKRFLSRYTAQMPEAGFPAFRERFATEIDHAESLIGEDAKKILLCDGARPLWKYLNESPRFADYECLLDFHHAMEHLSKAAEAIFGKGTAGAQKWYRRWRANFLEKENTGKSLIRSIDRYCNERKLSQSRKSVLARARTFFSRNESLMRYAEFRENGWPIGSGPVEAACKVVVKQRLCRSGMRWSREGGQRILNLRSIVKSGRWDAFWETTRRYEELEMVA